MEALNKIFILGGGGLLGYNTILEALRRGYRVKVVDTIELPDNLKFKEDKNIEYIVTDFFSLSDEEIIALLSDCDSFVYASGVDERVVFPKPARKFFYEKNVLTTERAARLARNAGVKNFVLFSSYTSEFAEKNQELRNNGYQYEPYVETRLLQEKLAMYAGEGYMKVSILRLPLVFGIMEGKVPFYSMFVDMLRGQDFMPVTLGGVSIISASQVGQAAISALENGEHRKIYPLSTGYISYLDFYGMIVEELDQEDKTKVQGMKFDELYDAYIEDKEYTDHKGVEHAISQVNMLRANEMELKLPTNVAFDSLRVREENLKDIIKATIHKANIKN